MIRKIIYWFHRQGFATPESCIRRGCEDYHGHSPSAHMRFLSLKRGSFLELFNKENKEVMNEQTE